MTTLNTGLLLRKPFESSYTAFRRFLIANADLGYSRVAESLRTMSPPSAAAPTLYQRAQWYERAYCEARNLVAPITPEDPLPPRCTRNCPRCAEVGYHHASYELPWLTHCPLHGDPLRDTCERCGRPWPTIAEIYTRPCIGCGIHIPVGALIERKAFAANLPFERLEILNACLQMAAELGSFSLTHDSSLSYSTTYQHIAISASSYYFPAVFCALKNSDNAALNDLRVPIYPVQIYHSEVTNITGQWAPIYHMERPMAWEARVRIAVFKKICRAIAYAAGPAHRICLAQVGFDPTAQTSCPYCIGLSIWHEYVGLNSSVGHGRDFHFGAMLYDKLGSGNIPAFPERMTTVQVFKSGETLRFALPELLQKLIYAIDLWTTFTNILLFVAYCYSQNCPKHRDRFAWHLTTLATPKNSITRAIGFTIDDSNNLTAVVPEALLADNSTLPEIIQASRRQTGQGAYFVQPRSCR